MPADLQALFLQFGDPARPGFLDSLGMRSSHIWQRLTGAPINFYSVMQSATQVWALLCPSHSLALDF